MVIVERASDVRMLLDGQRDVSKKCKMLLMREISTRPPTDRLFIALSQENLLLKLEVLTGGKEEKLIVKLAPF